MHVLHDLWLSYTMVIAISCYTLVGINESSLLYLLCLQSVVLMQAPRFNQFLFVCIKVTH